MLIHSPNSSIRYSGDKMEYKKLDIPFTERLTFLFTGLLSTRHLHCNKPVLSSIPSVKEEKVIINNIEEEELKMDIPFFDLDKTETKSNL